MQRLLAIMSRLRDKQSGCPWDVQQTYATIAPYTIEEAYEVADAIDRGDLDDLKDELGDLMFQVVFHSQMASETGDFSFEDVIDAISDKMIRRHPHVFGDADERDAEEQTKAWEAQKAAERAAKGDIDTSVLADLPVALPALKRAGKLTKRAARVGFDWPDVDQVFDKLDEELAELKDAMKSGDQSHITEEMGDLLFVLANLARKLSVEPEQALRDANAKFERRFRYIEQNIEKKAASIQEANLDQMEELWLEAKAVERQA
ncbi:nucleoside triphosphate pyrophosphohydrolase [Maricaulaceae bacterium EIL42A08]|nr:nucleoside triphosphate pyrophosphohydrolase [Maricaulaceae bacterium EIL42A08]